MFGSGWFFLNVLLTTVEFYKLYVNRYCKDQKFTLKKLISTRQDLTEVRKEWEEFDPAIIYEGR